MRREPALSLGIIATLTLSIGATTALFNRQQRAAAAASLSRSGRSPLIAGAVGRGGQLYSIFGPDYLAWKAQCTSCAEVAAVSGTAAANTPPVRKPIASSCRR